MSEQPAHFENILVESFQRLETHLQKVRVEVLDRATKLAAEDNPGEAVFCVKREHIDAAIKIALNRKRGEG